MNGVIATWPPNPAVSSVPAPVNGSSSCPAPIVLIIFNRPDLTTRVFSEIRRARPQRLFIIADGPRNAAERSRCDQTRSVVDRIDWPCIVERDYCEHNMGCRDRIVSGLNAVFKQVDDAIILEDDCLPAHEFFGFCAEMLERYRDNQQVMHITGTNLAPEGSSHEASSYWFSKYAHGWGWATWARAWSSFDLGLKSWADFRERRSHELFADAAERRHWIRKLRPFAAGERHDAWDFPWQFSIWMKRGICIVPRVNLISNIGHRTDATHTSHASPIADLPVGELPLPLVHPPGITSDETRDSAQFYATVEGRRLRERRTWRYRLSKPLRVYRKVLQQFAGTGQGCGYTREVG